MIRRALACSLALVSVCSVSGCGALPGFGDDTTKVTVWLMRNSASDDFVQRFKRGYEQEHKDVELDVRVQEWTGIGEKIDRALKDGDAPDVVEVGNTQVPRYAASGGLLDMTLESLRDWGSDAWLPGLAQPGNVDGMQYGIPWYAANRVVIYNKDLFGAAGITRPPKDRAEWLADTAKLNSGQNQGIYLAGQDWYTLAGFVWDEGGELAQQDTGDWKGALDSPAALRGMAFYKQLQALGDGPRNADEETPPQAGIFAGGKVAQMIAVPGAAKAIQKANPKLADKLGYFPIPGPTDAKPGAVFTGGSDLIIPRKTAHRAEAVRVVAALTGEKWQTDLAATMNYVPNKSTLAHAVQGQAGTAAMAKGAAQGRATPNSPQWAAVEADNPIKPYMTSVLNGADPKKAAKAASDRVTTLLFP
ncbi:extracellular solute-binding protein [Streptomyces sp. ASQP_92]|uniref:extracellular solute-binding protein n=1 Tax=Streptomyces sp. ASQP_92 TaxID=2979116 RepID=UPI0021BF8A58|nr:extracellular solute-binding protein [Streptomyces sp. ASQP_92]MCT9090337.1 extracellular solute-binding protein [Streptomyces sp. ASQP_92]